MTALRRAYAGITRAWDGLKTALTEWWPYVALALAAVLILAAMAAYAALVTHADAQQDMPHQACYAHTRRIDTQVSPMTVEAAMQHIDESVSALVTEWALLRGHGTHTPAGVGTMLLGPTVASTRPTWDGYPPEVTGGGSIVHRRVVYGPWVDDTGQSVDVACSSCLRPAGAGVFAKGRLCNACAVTR